MTEVITKELTTFEQQVNNVSVRNIDDKENAVSILKALNDKRKAIVEFFKPTKEQARKAWQAIVNQEKEYLDKIDILINKIKAEILKYDREVEAERLRLQAKAEEEARKERERLLKQAEKVKTPELKDALRHQAEMVVTPTVSLPEQKVNGVSKRIIWKARVVDVNQLPREYMVPNEQLLNKVAQSTKGELKIPGVEFYKEEIVIVK